jgi:hypothetical protein
MRTGSGLSYSTVRIIADQPRDFHLPKSEHVINARIFGSEEDYFQKASRKAKCL